MLETLPKGSATATQSALKPRGPAMAALLSAGIGVFVIGVATVLATASAATKDALNWWDPVGPLSGKTGVGVIAWLVAWALLHLCWRRKEVEFRRVWWITLALLIGGVVLTFPPVFEAFARH